MSFPVARPWKMKRKNRREKERERKNVRKELRGVKGRKKSRAETSESGRSSIAGSSSSSSSSVAKRGRSTTTVVAVAKKLCLLGELPSLSFARFRERPGTDLKTNEGPLSLRAELQD